MKSSNIYGTPFFIIMIALVVSIKVPAQDRHLDTLYSYQPVLMNNDDVVSLTGGGSFFNNSNQNGIIADAMLYPYWQQGVVNFKNGRQLRDVDLKFNLLKNELYFNNEGKPNFFADTVTSFSIFDTSNHRLAIARFANGYPDLAQLTDKTYYLVLTAGPNAQLLRYISKRKQDIYEYSAPSKTVYTFTEELLVYDVKNNALKAIKNNAASIQRALPEYAAAIQQSVQDKKSKNLSDEDMMQIIQQVNGIHL